MILLLVPLLIGWFVCLMLLIIFHLVWNDAAEEVRYALGAFAILIGCATAGLIIDQPILVVGPAIIASAGLAIPLIQHFERKADAARKNAARNAQKNGEVIGAAHRLSQEIIDRGGLSEDETIHRN